MAKTKDNVKGSRSIKLLILLQMIICVVGIYVCFAMWSLKQERIVKKPYESNSTDTSGKEYVKTEYFHTVFGISLLQSLAGMVVGIVLLALQTLWQWLSTIVCYVKELHVFRSTQQLEQEQKKLKKRDSKSKMANVSTLSMSWYDVYLLFLVGFTNVFATSLAYAAMRRLSFPVVLTMKMSKMIPVMVVGFCYHHTRYPTRKVLACLLITIGILTFYLLDESSYSQKTIPRNSERNNFKNGDITTFNTSIETSSNISSSNDILPSVDLLDNLSSNTTNHNKPQLSAFWPSSGVIGLFLLLANLVMDGFTNSTQDVLVKKHNWSGNKLMVYVNLVSFVWTLAAMLFMEMAAEHYLTVLHHIYKWMQQSHLFAPIQVYLPSLTYWQTHRLITRDLSFLFYFLTTFPEALRDVFMLVAFNVCGQFFIFRTIALFGTLTLTTMTLLRKGGSVILSIVVHQHKVSLAQWVALALVAVGVVCETIININERARATLTSSKVHSSHAAYIQSVINNKNKNNNERKPRRALQQQHLHHHHHHHNTHDAETEANNLFDNDNQIHDHVENQHVEAHAEEQQVVQRNVNANNESRKKKKEQQRFSKRENANRNALNTIKFDKNTRKQPSAPVNKHSTALSFMKKKQ